MYYLIYSVLWLLSLIPVKVLYLFSDFTYLMMYSVFKYRKEVVYKNLLQAFPEKTEAERTVIAKQFYRNFIDTIFETIRFITITKKEINEHGTGDYDLINNLAAKGKNIHIMVGHQFNWEYANLLYSMNLHTPFIAVYMPFKNKHIDKIFYKFRSQYGNQFISAPDFKNKKHDVFLKQYTLALAADQNPGDPSNAYWIDFLGKPAPFITGPAKGAVKNNTAVMIVGFGKTKRGHYHFTPTLITENGSLFTPEQLTVMYKNELEKIIRKDPANYLWSHRRWKYDWKPEYGEIIK